MEPNQYQRASLREMEREVNLINSAIDRVQRLKAHFIKSGRFPEESLDPDTDYHENSLHRLEFANWLDVMYPRLQAEEGLMELMYHVWKSAYAKGWADVIQFPAGHIQLFEKLGVNREELNEFLKQKRSNANGG